MQNIEKVNRALPLIVFFIIVLFFHLLLVPEKFADDIFFSKIMDESNLVEWLKWRYDVWSSRTIIEGLLVILSSSNLIYWKILNSLIFTLIAFAISYLVQSNKKLDWCIVLAILLMFPIKIVSGAGWIATTLNYLWPLAFGLVALFPIRKYFSKRKIHRWEYPIYIFSLIIACNVEQMCVILLVSYLLFIGYIHISKGKKYLFPIISLIVSILSMIYIFISPGNSARSIAETVTWFPYFNELSTYTKILLGISTTFSELVVNYNLFWFLNPPPEGVFIKGEIDRILNILVLSNVPFIILSIAIPIMVQKLHKKVNYTIISLIPLIAIFVFNQLLRAVFIDNDNFTKITDESVFQQLKIGLPQFNLPILFGIIIIISILISFYWIVNSVKKWIILSLILCAGICSRVIIGLSPTVFASGERTSIYLYFSIIICLVFLIKSFQESREIVDKTSIKSNK